MRFSLSKSLWLVALSWLVYAWIRVFFPDALSPNSPFWQGFAFGISEWTEPLAITRDDPRHIGWIVAAVSRAMMCLVSGALLVLAVVYQVAWLLDALKVPCPFGKQDPTKEPEAATK